MGFLKRYFLSIYIRLADILDGQLLNGDIFVSPFLERAQKRRKKRLNQLPK